jgi:hypothetical protein
VVDRLEVGQVVVVEGDPALRERRDLGVDVLDLEAERGARRRGLVGTGSRTSCEPPARRYIRLCSPLTPSKGRPSRSE